MTSDKGPQVTLSLDQHCVVAALERIMHAIDAEAAVLRNISKLEPAEKLITAGRHLAKYRVEYLESCQRSIVLAHAGVIPDIKGEGIH